MAAIKHEQQVILLVAASALLGLGVYYVAVAGPVWRSLSAQREGIRTAQTSLQQIEQAIAREPQLRTQLEALTTGLKTLHEALPVEETLPASIERLSEMATQSGLKIQTIFPQRTIESRDSPPSAGGAPAELYKEVPIQIDALSGYHQLGMFLSGVERHAQPMRLKNLRVTSSSKDGKRHNVKMVVVAYFATSQAKRVDAILSSTAEQSAR